MTITLYWQGSLPQHTIVCDGAGGDEAWYLVPLIPGGWQRRTPYRGHVSGLHPMEPHAAWPVLCATLGIPVTDEDSEPLPAKDGEYTAPEVAALLSLSEDRIRRLAVRLGVGRKHGRDWLFSAADVAVLRARNTQRGRPPLPEPSAEARDFLRRAEGNPTYRDMLERLKDE